MIVIVADVAFLSKVWLYSLRFLMFSLLVYLELSLLLAFNSAISFLTQGTYWIACSAFFTFYTYLDLTIQETSAIASNV